MEERGWLSLVLRPRGGSCWCGVRCCLRGLALLLFFMAIGCYRRRCGGCVQLMMHLKKKGGCLLLMTEGVDDAEYGVKR